MREGGQGEEVLKEHLGEREGGRERDGREGTGKKTNVSTELYKLFSKP